MHTHALTSLCCSCGSKQRIASLFKRSLNDRHACSVFMMCADKFSSSSKARIFTRISFFNEMVKYNLPMNTSRTVTNQSSIQKDKQHILGFKSCIYPLRINRKSMSSLSILSGEIDRYNGMWIDLRQLLSKEDGDISMDEFDGILRDSLKIWESKRITCVWLIVPIKQSRFIEAASRHDFIFHHAEGTSATLTRFMDEAVRNRIPSFASHQIGVSGVAINEEKQEILVVMDKNRRYKLWKFPGGLSDLGEDIAETAMREVHEETGVKTEFQSILAFRQQHDQPNAFGRSDIYVICRLKPLNFDLQPCPIEIAAIKWIPVEELLQESDVSQMTQLVANLVLQGLRHGFHTVDITSSQVESIYKKTKINMFTRPWSKCG